MHDLLGSVTELLACLLKEKLLVTLLLKVDGWMDLTGQKEGSLRRSYA